MPKSPDDQAIMTNRWIVMTIIGVLIAVFSGMHILELAGEEPRRSVVAYEMMASGEYIAPQLYGLPYYNKPPVHNWTIVASTALFGKHEWASRLPGVLSFLLSGSLLFYFLRKEVDDEHAILGAILFLSAGDLLLYATVNAGEIDLTFMFFLLANGIFLFKSLNSTNRQLPYWCLTYVFLALATLTKGFQAIPFHLLPMMAYVIYYKQISRILTWQHAFGLLVGSALVGGYYFLLAMRADIGIWYANLFIESGSKMTTDGIGELINQLTEAPIVLLKLAAPWSLAALLLFKKNIRVGIARNPAIAFSIIYIISHFWLYWFIIDVRDRYLYPFVPWFIMLVAAIIIKQKWWPSKKKIILVIISVLILARIGLNVFYMPKYQSGELSDRLKYRPLLEEIASVTNGAEIQLYTELEKSKLPTPVNGVTHLDRQPVVPYQIPYYFHQNTGDIMTWSDTLISNKYYLIFEDESNTLPATDTILSFEEGWTHRPMLLVRIK